MSTDADIWPWEADEAAREEKLASMRDRLHARADAEIEWASGEDDPEEPEEEEL